MKSVFLQIVYGIIGLCFLSACDVHEFPDTPEPNIQKLRLQLEFHTDLPQHQIVPYAMSKTASSAAEAYDVRYTIHIYEVNADGNFSSDLYTSIVETKDDVQTLEHEISLELEPGIYRFMVWTDYVDAGSKAHKFYNTDDFKEITLYGDEHHGNTNYRDAFRGVKDTEITNGVDVVKIEMERPLSRYNFVTTDLDKFITKVLSSRSQAEESANTKVVDLNDYRVLFHYTGFMPSAFNIFSDKPVDAKTGVWYEGQIAQISETEAELGFDYVFVNGTESTVQVAVEIYESGGALVASSEPIDVPIVRSKCTTVRGEFLTSETSGGIGIDPDFEGDFNYEVK